MEESTIVFVTKQIKQTVVIIEAYHYYKLDTILFQHNFVKVNSMCRRKLFRILSVDFELTD